MRAWPLTSLHPTYLPHTLVGCWLLQPIQSLEGASRPSSDAPPELASRTNYSSVRPYKEGNTAEISMHVIWHSLSISKLKAQFTAMFFCSSRDWSSSDFFAGNNSTVSKHCERNTARSEKVGLASRKKCPHSIKFPFLFGNRGKVERSKRGDSHIFHFTSLRHNGGSWCSTCGLERWTNPTPGTATQLPSLLSLSSAHPWEGLPGMFLPPPSTHPSFPGSCVLALLQLLGCLHLPLPAMKTLQIYTTSANVDKKALSAELYHLSKAQMEERMQKWLKVIWQLFFLLRF